MSQQNKKVIPKQYFSKWRKKWIDFKIPPGELELKKLRKYHYQLR